MKRCAFRTIAQFIERSPYRLFPVVVGAIAALAPLLASAHAPGTVAPDELLARWRLDPWITLLLILTGWLYWRGAAWLNRIADRSGRVAVISGVQRLSFWAGLAVFAIALDSPLDEATGTVFSAHMIQHMLLIAVAPPLLLAGRPFPALMRGLPGNARAVTAAISRRASWMRNGIPVLALPLVAWIVQAVALWAWHEPGLYQAAVRHTWIHLLEHATFVVTALLYWWAIIPGPHGHSRFNPGSAILSLFAMGMQGAALGALLTFSGKAWYPIYEGRSELWGFSALSDQRLAGLIMWIPAGSVYVVAALVILGIWLGQDRPGRSVPPATGGALSVGETAALVVPAEVPRLRSG